MKENDKIISYLLNTKEPYVLEKDNIKIEIKYTDTNKSFKECMLNVLKQKIGGET